MEERLRQNIAERFGAESRGLMHGRFVLGEPASGLSVQRVFSGAGCFVLFEWADWPVNLQAELGARVEEFHRDWPHLTRVTPGCAEWSAILGGVESDPASARQVGEIFRNRWGEASVAWVVSERDLRGRSKALVSTSDLGEIGFEFSWRGIGVWAFGAADRQTLRPVMDDLHRWASGRVQPILDTLMHKLQELYGDRFRGLYVFGSYARPDAGIELPIDSDLDIALLLSEMENRYDEMARISEVVSDLSLEHGLVISVVPIREADFREGRTNFTRVISEYAIPVE